MPTEKTILQYYSDYVSDLIDRYASTLRDTDIEELRGLARNLETSSDLLSAYAHGITPHTDQAESKSYILKRYFDYLSKRNIPVSSNAKIPFFTPE